MPATRNISMNTINGSMVRKRETAQSAWRPDRWMSILSFIVALTALSCSLRSCSIAKSALDTSRQVAHLDIEPDLRGYVQGDIPNDDLVLLNDGPLPAINCSISRLHHYVSVNDEQMSAISYGFRPTPKADFDPDGVVIRFIPKLDCKQTIRLPLSAGACINTPTSSVEIIEVTLQYYRESDLMKFKKTLRFVQYDLKLYNYDGFMKHSLYDTTIKNYKYHLTQIKKLGSLAQLQEMAKLPQPTTPAESTNEFVEVIYPFVMPVFKPGEQILFPPLSKRHHGSFIGSPHEIK
jgi:hypothetical protein